MSNFLGWTRTGTAKTSATATQFLEVTDLLLERVQLNSTHLFRADILYDSLGKLQTIFEKETSHSGFHEKESSDQCQREKQKTSEPPTFNDFNHHRTVLRRLIPRKPQLDRALEQSCFIYFSTQAMEKANQGEVLVVYTPHCQTPESMPWYHPKVQGVAYHFSQLTPEPTISVYYLPFPDQPVSDRIERTMVSLLNTSIRLLKTPSKARTAERGELTNDMSKISLAASVLKDTILPQHVVQNTYTRLKEAYASDLIARWVESTEPSKHVFEDLSIAAFLIELWNTMYSRAEFPGFVDIACGNGVLTYLLTKEGWHGRGFDARRRKTWDILDLDDCLDEAVCIPEPFLTINDPSNLEGLSIHNGMFSAGTFIISNHADELTCWTPILAALSQPTNPLPFLAIPCCSHALDGSKHRYTLKEVAISSRVSEDKDSEAKAGPEDMSTDHGKPAHGDLKALRAEKLATYNHTNSADKSMYACLTRKTAALAQELGFEVELTLMRIPSTRNIGVVGNRKKFGVAAETGINIRISDVLARECASVGGIKVSAHTWTDKAKKLQGGQGRGKVNWNGPRA